VNRFKALIVDFGGVLTNPLAGVMRDFCRAEGLADDALVELFTRNPAGRAVFAAIEAGAIDQPAWEETTAALLGVPARNLLRRILTTMCPAPAMLDVVEAARRAGYATACLTNSFGLEPYDPYAPWKLSERFDVLVISGQERLRKPDAVIYQRTLDRLGLPGEACLYLDDIEANLDPARQLGMTAWLVDEPEITAAQVAAELGLDDGIV
jgi:putative hydrolase of the HAD superfamily